MKRFAILLLLLSLLSAQANVTTEGGNVTRVFLNGTRLSENWDGLYGQVVLGIGATQTYTGVGNNISIMDLSGSSPPAGCSAQHINIIATNNTLPILVLPLSPGSITQLDELINSSENASNVFTFTDSYSLSVGSFSNIPSTYTRSYNNQNNFEMGYLNDANGNIVFVAKYNSDKVDWNNTHSDYQIMLPKGTSNMAYNIWVDVVYTCRPPSHERHHELYILPIPPQTAIIGRAKGVIISVENTGDYTETNVRVSVVCPPSFSCGNASLGSIGEGDEKNATIWITGNEIGTFILKVEARSDDAYAYREFYFIVEPECRSNEDCPPQEYCEEGVCVEKKGLNETCNNDYECKTGLCEEGKCAECRTNQQCDWNEECVGGTCVEVLCKCGVVENHACIPYECCSNEECGVLRVCLNHNCTDNLPSMDVIGKNMTEGAYVDVLITDILGNPIEGAYVYTESMGVYTDGSGRARIRIPYSGVIYANALGQTLGKHLNITRLAYIKTKDFAYVLEEVEGNVLDSRSKPIGIVKIFYENKTTNTDENSVFRIKFESPGMKEVSGKKYGYLVKSATIEVVSPAEVCYFPYLLNIVGFRGSGMFILWVAAAIIGGINFLFYRKRVGSKFVRGFLYSFAPLILSIPNSWPFSICFMINVSFIQLIFEAFLFLKIKRNEKKNKKK